ncbi:MAG: hypothetical protein M1826_007749 [Phylliscum demangeonii]|nr:MAG: hypothetical protein M1826_007749 [Phylliscum demangeonii]
MDDDDRDDDHDPPPSYPDAVSTTARTHDTWVLVASGSLLSCRDLHAASLASRSLTAIFSARLWLDPVTTWQRSRSLRQFPLLFRSRVRVRVRVRVLVVVLASLASLAIVVVVVVVRLLTWTLTDHQSSAAASFPIGRFVRCVARARAHVRAWTRVLDLAAAGSSIGHDDGRDGGPLARGWLATLLLQQAQRLPRLTCVCLAGSGLVDHGALALRAAPSSPSSPIALLDLHHCPHASLHTLLAAPLLRSCRRLVYLDLSSSSSSSSTSPPSPSTIQLLATSLRQLPTLQILKLRDARLTDAHLRLLAPALAIATTTTTTTTTGTARRGVWSLDVRDNALTDEGVRALREACFRPPPPPPPPFAPLDACGDEDDEDEEEEVVERDQLRSVARRLLAAPASRSVSAGVGVGVGVGAGVGAGAGLSHLRIAGNDRISVDGGLRPLLLLAAAAGGRLRVLDCGGCGRLGAGLVWLRVGHEFVTTTTTTGAVFSPAADPDEADDETDDEHDTDTDTEPDARHPISPTTLPPPRPALGHHRHRLATLVLTDVPTHSTAVARALIAFLIECGRREACTPTPPSASSSFGLRTLRLEFLDRAATATATAAEAAAAAARPASITQDPDSDRFWRASHADFSFFAPEEEEVVEEVVEEGDGVVRAGGGGGGGGEVGLGLGLGLVARGARAEVKRRRRRESKSVVVVEEEEEEDDDDGAEDEDEEEEEEDVVAALTRFRAQEEEEEELVPEIVTTTAAAADT